MAYYTDLNYLLDDGERSTIADINDIYQAIYTLFGTKKGSRVFRPDYGANLAYYLFEPCDELTASSIMYDITNALKEDTRITLNTTESSVTPDPLNRRFIIQLRFDIPSVSEYNRTLTLTLDQDE